MKDNVVIVLDTSNYKKSYSEEIPFKAIVLDKYENEILVKSIVTGKEYELYYSQILEGLDIDEIKFILCGGEYGMYDYELIKISAKKN
jgi:hypothetical protein